MVELSSQIRAATVFPDSVRVTRRARQTVEVGLQRLAFVELPETLDPATLRVAARGSVPVKLLGVDARLVHYTDTPAAKVRELEAQLQQLKDEEAVDADRATTLTKHLAHLDGLGEATRIFAHGLAQGRHSLDQQVALLGFLDHSRDTYQDRLRALKLQRRTREKEIHRVDWELSQLRAGRPRQRYTVTVEVELTTAGEVEVEVIYVLRNASWQPLYDVRALGNDIEITYLGEVAQNTGEDWQQVSLTLSTARPSVTAVIPRLQPWVLRPHVPIVMAASPPARGMAASWRGPATEGDTDFEMAMTMAAPAAAAPALMAAEVEVAKVEQSGASVTFGIPGNVDVPSDNTPHKTTVGIFRLQPTFDYVVVPKIAETVFRRAKVANSSPFVLLPGRAQLFVGDDFIGATTLPHTAPGQTVDLCFGPDDRIRMERGLTKKDVSKTFMSGRRRIQYAFEIRLWNHTDAAQLVTVVDQIPHPQHEEIKVTLETVDPKPHRQDKLNIVIWKISIPANGEKKITYAFTVEHPKDMPVVGLS